MHTLTADVAIIGGGAAGCYAALNLQKRGLKPLIICKGLVGKSGASLFAGNLVISGRLLGNSEAQARNTAEFLIKYHNQFLIDQEWARRCGAWIEQVYYPELEELGLYFRRDDEGNVVTSPGAIRSVAANVQGNSGVPFMDLRRKQVIRAGIPRLEETVATELLRNSDGNIGGVFCLNYMTGEYVIVRARAVVLATGYSDRLHQRSTGTREMSADGLAMAWRAGATMVNMEMQWWHTNDIADPPTWQRMQVYPNPMLGSEKSARMVNSAGEEFFNQQNDDPLAFGPYTVQLKALVKQVHAGKARYDGGYYAGFDNCDANEVETYTTYGKTFRQLGLRFPEQLVETAVTSHYRQGGIDVDTATMRSSIPGLYAAGGVSGHSNGLIGLATYDGKVVSDGIAAEFNSLADRPISESRVRSGKAQARKIAQPFQRRRLTGQGQGKAPQTDVGQGRRREERHGPALGARRPRGNPSRRAARHGNCCTKLGGKLRMAGCHRRHEHGRGVRVDRSFVARAQGEPRPLHPHRFSSNRQQELAGRERPEEIRQRPALRAAAVSASVLLTRF